MKPYDEPITEERFLNLIHILLFLQFFKSLLQCTSGSKNIGNFSKQNSENFPLSAGLRQTEHWLVEGDFLSKEIDIGWYVCSQKLVKHLSSLP